MRTDIPLLQNVRVASPCSASWQDMTPIQGERVRFCDGCQKRVYNLSALGQAEAEGLLRSHEGHLCVRYYRRRDGTILTADCPVGLAAARRLVLMRTKVSVGLCAILCVAFAAHQTMQRPAVAIAGGVERERPAPEITHTMGAIAAPTTTPEEELGKMPSKPPELTPIMGDATLGTLSPSEEIGHGKSASPEPTPLMGKVSTTPSPSEEMGRVKTSPEVTPTIGNVAPGKLTPSEEIGELP